MSSKVTVKNINIGIDEASRAKIAEGLSRPLNTSQNSIVDVQSLKKLLFFRYYSKKPVE